MNVARLRETLRLDPVTGFLYWKPRQVSGSWNARHAGKRAGGYNERGYRVVRIDGVKYYEHRVIVAMQTGIDPGTKVVDHDSGHRDVNAPHNLQPVTNAENVRKRHRRNKNNTSGVHGVYWHNASGKWCASIKVDQKKVHIGLFADLEDAAAARRHAENEHFGAFAPRIEPRRAQL